MKVIIVDDEPKAIALIRSYLSHFSNFELVATFRNGLKALEFLNTNRIDVIFLDINMPHLSGLSLSKMIAPDTDIVFTTAYSEHAVESYDVNALDYLLKPISLERFSKTMTRLLDKHHAATKKDPGKSTAPKTLFIRSGLQTHRVKINDIAYLQKDGNYIHYYIVNDKKIMARQSIAEALGNLTASFLQVQKSYIINFDRIDAIGSDYITIGPAKIPIGNQFKAALMSKLK